MLSSMPKVKPSKYRALQEGQLANFPEEKPMELMNSRHLAVAVSLVIVLSAFAALIAPESPTGLASAAVERWRSLGLFNNWRATNAVTARVTQTKIPEVVPANYYCPKYALSPPKEYARSANANDCFIVKGSTGNNYDYMCAYRGKIGTAWIQCIPQ